MAVPLVHYPVTHGEIRKMVHPRLGVEVDNQTSVRYLRFARPVEIDRLELPRSAYGRWTPAVPTHPAHLIVSVPDEPAGAWRVVCDLDLPYDPRIAGEGLRQDMDLAEIEALFAAILKEPPLCINLGGLRASLLRVECDREHPVWQNHGECNGSPYSVPYGILNGLSAYGNGPNPYRHEFSHYPPLKKGVISPIAPQGMTVRQTPLGLFYTGPAFSVGFSLARPMLVHLGWDILRAGQAENNRLKADWAMGVGQQLAGLSGPLLRTAEQDFGAQHWSGEVAVAGNRVGYRHLSVQDGLFIDACFEVEPDGLSVEIRQTCTRPVFALEYEPWRFVWDLRQGMTAAAALPTCAPGRNGQASFPLAFSSDGVGCLSASLVSRQGAEWFAQVESFREAGVVTCGFTPFHPAPGALGVVQPGEEKMKMRLIVDAFKPAGQNGQMDAGLARHWGSVLSCFRPEHRGFSNNPASVNCHLSQVAPADVVGVTLPLSNGLDPIRLGRFTLKRALLDGGGYGYWRNLYLDSDPSLLIAAGKLHQARPDHGWLGEVEPGLRETAQRILDLRDDSGLVLCRDLSGNSGSYRWSCNTMDVVGVGHLDAYVNGLAYRGLRCAAAMFADLGQAGLAGQCRQAALDLRAAYAGAFLNPATGWLAGWRSRDGELHDYGFLWVNGLAIAYGLLEPDAARQALLNLEAARQQVGADHGYFGLPSNLFPISSLDHMMPLIWGTPQPTFELYTDGGNYGMNAANYLRALSIYGLKEAAARLADELEYGLAAGYFNGGLGQGTEFRTWDGLCTGYEGTLIGNFGPVYALAVERGVIQPAEPEWWPAGG